MSEYPRKGDRVKVTYEGEVTAAADALESWVDVRVGDRVVSLPARGASIKVLERTYPAGTVVVSQLEPKSPAVSQGDGTWRGAGSASWALLTDQTVRTNPHFTVVYEPPA